MLLLWAKYSTIPIYFKLSNNIAYSPSGFQSIEINELNFTLFIYNIPLYKTSEFYGYQRLWYNKEIFPKEVETIKILL